jgi:hypothetical protein
VMCRVPHGICVCLFWWLKMLTILCV